MVHTSGRTSGHVVVPDWDWLAVDVQPDSRAIADNVSKLDVYRSFMRIIDFLLTTLIVKQS
jgi:hypothetical protein